MEVKTVEKEDISSVNKTIIGQFLSESGEATGSNLEIPLQITHNQLETLINHVLNNEEKLPYSFFINDTEIIGDLKSTFDELKCSTEEILKIVYQPQAIFRAKAVTRCTGSLSGHSEAVLCVSFSPDGSKLATGSGDTTVRFWDIDTSTPLFTCKGHTSWVLYVSWSPDGKKLATGGMDNTIRIWDPNTGKQVGPPLQGHKKYVTAISWEPYHKNPDSNKLASASKDGTIKIWDTRVGRCIFSLSSHTASVTCVKWGGEDLLYSGSQDRTIKVWNPNEGKLVRTLEGHAHWVNSLALNTDYVMKMGAFDHNGKQLENKDDAQKAAQERFNAVVKLTNNTERLLSASDDFTMFLWEGAKSKRPITRMTGHQQLINLACFSPDGRLIASASFDKSIKLWSATTGKFVSTLRGHVEAVYQVSWSPDSRMLVSASRDSTVKLWDVRTHKLKYDLPGHADEVYAVDWCGDKVASGSKDRLVKIWQN